MPEDEDEFEDQIDVLCSCGFRGKVRLYNIGDGPEWCCPSCDMCFPSNPVVGPDGKTNAERSMMEFAEKVRKDHGWP